MSMVHPMWLGTIVAVVFARAEGWTWSCDVIRPRVFTTTGSTHAAVVTGGFSSGTTCLGVSTSSNVGDVRVANGDDAQRRKSPALWRYDLATTTTTTTTTSTSPLPPSLEESSFSTDANANVNANTSPFPRRNKRRTKPEVMAPAGGWPQLRAAVSNGADAVYLGLEAYSARARADNFSFRDLAEAVSYAHSFGGGVKVYVALNTLVFDNELEEVERAVRACVSAEVDAVIVQDLGLCRLVREILAEVYGDDDDDNDNHNDGRQHRMEIHASTQQTVTSADGVRFAASVGGATRVVLGRELSVEDIQQVYDSLQRTAALTSNDSDRNNDSDPDVEVEVFVHGALCVSYSGQCFSSEAWGGRSANRGQCAQACRLPYQVIKDGTELSLSSSLSSSSPLSVFPLEGGDAATYSYALSPQDLCGLQHVPALMEAGVSCLKIEGRLKDERYVAATTAAYREAVDRCWAQYEKEADDDNDDGDNNDNDCAVTKVTRSDLAQVFARGQDERHDGLSAGFLDGPAHQTLVRGRSPRHRGVHVGRICRQSTPSTGLWIRLSSSTLIETETTTTTATATATNVVKLKPGDGIVVDAGRPHDYELGGPVYVVEEVANPIDFEAGPDNEGPIVCVRLGSKVERQWKKWEKQQRHQHQQQQSTFTSTSTSTPKELAPVGAHVWKTRDATVDRKLRKLAEASGTGNYTSSLSSSSFAPKKTPVVRVTVTGRSGEALQFHLHTQDGTTGIGSTAEDGCLVPSSGTHGLDRQTLRKALGSLGDSDVVVLSHGRNGNGDDNDDWFEHEGLEEGLFCPPSWLKAARRRAVRDLEEALLRKQDQPTTLSSLSPSSNENERVGSMSHKTTKAMKGQGQGQGQATARWLLQTLRQDGESATAAASIDPTVEPPAITQATTTITTPVQYTMKLSVLVRNLDQVHSLCRWLSSSSLSTSQQVQERQAIVDEVIIDFLEVEGMKEAVECLLTHRVELDITNANLRIVVASPRIVKAHEGEGMWKALLRLGPIDGLLVRSAGLLYRLTEMGGPGATVQFVDRRPGPGPDSHHDQTTTASGTTTTTTIPALYGDVSLNAVNALTAWEYLQAGADRIALGHDLNGPSISRLAQTLGPNLARDRLEVVVHSHLPIFHTEHCVFARFLSKGNSYLDCGHVCTRHTVHLRGGGDATATTTTTSTTTTTDKDRNHDHDDHLVLADMGCRNTVFASRAQSGLLDLNSWREAGIGRVRIELLEESTDAQIHSLLDGYADVVAGNLRPQALWKSLLPTGITLGSFRNAPERRAGSLD